MQCFGTCQILIDRDIFHVYVYLSEKLMTWN
jgi:hypothetical protein